MALVRSEAEAFGHTFKGRFTRVPQGLAWAHNCTKCRAYVVVTPAWAPWEATTFEGPAVRDYCSAR